MPSVSMRRVRGDVFQIVDAALGGSSEEEGEEEEESKPDGHKTAEFLFSFGATCLERYVVPHCCLQLQSCSFL